MLILRSIIASVKCFKLPQLGTQFGFKKAIFDGNAIQMRSYNHMSIKPSRFQWNKFKDQLHFYIMLGVIPITGIILYTNIFVGPATLEQIPEDYEPDYWEYHRHPISRFLARYILPSPQQEYEKMLHYVFEENEKALIRKLENDIRQKMAESNDYQAYYYRPVLAKYWRVSKEAADELEALRGN